MDDRRWKYNLDILDTHPGKAHHINRENLYDDVLNLYSTSVNSILQESPFRVKFSDEKAIDVGGVSRDMLSGFWEEAYLRSFDGGSVLTPAMHSGLDLSVFPVLGTILSHGFLSSGFLPVRIAFPVLAAVILGPAVSVPTHMVIESFADYLSTYESSVVGNALSLVNSGLPFSNELTSKLIEILSRMGCCEVPKLSNFKALIAEVASFNFVTKCMGAIYAFHSGIPASHHSFWKDFTVEEFHKLYKTLIATPQRVLGLLTEPDCGTAAQGRVFGYLTTFIGDMKQQELSSFIRFVTGNSVLIAKEITVTFNNLSGLARRPTSNTCTSTLHLPFTYGSYQEFANEFFTVLRSDVCSVWAMDAI